MLRSRKKLTKKFLEYLSRNRLMALGTARDNKPWGATVFFAYDKNCNLFFYSSENTKHCKNIVKNPYVSIVINQEWSNKGLIRGAQILGKATKVSNKNLRHFYGIYKARFNWADKFAADHTLYIIKPVEIWYIDQKLFGHFYRVKIK